MYCVGVFLFGDPWINTHASIIKIRNKASLNRTLKQSYEVCHAWTSHLVNGVGRASDRHSWLAGVRILTRDSDIFFVPSSWQINWTSFFNKIIVYWSHSGKKQNLEVAALWFHPHETPSVHRVLVVSTSVKLLGSLIQVFKSIFVDNLYFGHICFHLFLFRLKYWHKTFLLEVSLPSKLQAQTGVDCLSNLFIEAIFNYQDLYDYQWLISDGLVVPK